MGHKRKFLQEKDHSHLCADAQEVVKALTDIQNNRFQKFEEFFSNMRGSNLTYCLEENTDVMLQNTSGTFRSIQRALVCDSNMDSVWKGYDEKKQEEILEILHNVICQEGEVSFDSSVAKKLTGEYFNKGMDSKRRWIMIDVEVDDQCLTINEDPTFLISEVLSMKTSRFIAKLMIWKKQYKKSHHATSWRCGRTEMLGMLH